MNDRLSAVAKRRLTCFMGINGFFFLGMGFLLGVEIPSLCYPTKPGPPCLTHRKWASRASSPDSKGCSLEWAKHNFYILKKNGLRQSQNAIATHAILNGQILAFSTVLKLFVIILSNLTKHKKCNIPALRLQNPSLQCLGQWQNMASETIWAICQMWTWWAPVDLHV